MPGDAAVRGRASLTSAGTATIIAYATSTRIGVLKGLITVSVGTGVAVGSIIETDSTGSDSAVMVGKWSCSAPMVLPFDFGPAGVLSSLNSRVVLQLESSNASVFCSVVGERR